MIPFYAAVFALAFFFYFWETGGLGHGGDAKHQAPQGLWPRFDVCFVAGWCGDLRRGSISAGWRFASRNLSEIAEENSDYDEEIVVCASGTEMALFRCKIVTYFNILEVAFLLNDFIVNLKVHCSF